MQIKSEPEVYAYFDIHYYLETVRNVGYSLIIILSSFREESFG